MTEIIKEFNMTGACVIDVEALSKAWDHRFWLSQWKDEYRLVQYLRRGSGRTKIKCDISPEQAQEIIQTLQLVRTQALFASASSWRKQGQSEFDMQPKKRKLA